MMCSNRARFSQRAALFAERFEVQRGQAGFALAEARHGAEHPDERLRRLASPA